MSKNILFLSAILTLCTSLLLFQNAPKLVINNIEDFFKLSINLLISNPIATLLLIFSIILFYKTFSLHH